MQNNSSTQKRQAGRLSYCQYHNNGAIYKEPYYQDLLLHPSSQHSASIFQNGITSGLVAEVGNAKAQAPWANN